MDIDSVKEILRCLDRFKYYSSLQLNLTKSEIGWVGKEGKNLNDIETIKKIDFRSDGTKILGIFFSHSKALMHNNNFMKKYENFKSILSLWKTRNLTIYGKVHVIRSLAISQLLYICSNLSIPKKFIENVQKEIVRFIWRGRKPKIKYQTLIGNLSEGGIRLPDLETMIETNRVKWAFKLLDRHNSNFWKGFANVIFEQAAGGLEIIGENFDPIKIKDKRIPEFYKEIINSWSKVSECIVEKPEEILRQPIWFNKFIKLDIHHYDIRKFIKKGIINIQDIWDCTDGPKWESIKEKGKWCESEYFTWRSLIAALPMVWKRTLKNTQNLEPLPHSQISVMKSIKISGEYIPFAKVKNKMVYWEIIKKKFRNPTSQKYISNKLGIPDIEWPEVYQRVYLVTNDIKLRAFQYKILNNCLFLNKDLYRFKLIDSPNCVFCQTTNETMEHFFVECHFSKRFYIEIKNWLQTEGIKLPDLNLTNVILGSDNETINEFLFLLYKFLLYFYRTKGIIPKLINFQTKLQEYESIEYAIAKNNGKLDTHFKKYEKILTSLHSI